MRSYTYHGLFTLPDSDTDSDCKPNGYIVLTRTFHTAQSQIQIPTPTGMESECGSVNVK